MSDFVKTEIDERVQQKMDVQNMQIALKLAELAASELEVPIGAIIVNEANEVIGRGYNTRESTQNAINHAEIVAIQEATKNIGSWRLENCTLYVTLEPCPMCSGAIIQSRIPRVVFGAMDPKGGTVGSLLNLLTDYPFNHKPTVVTGILATECSEILKCFFQKIRKK